MNRLLNIKNTFVILLLTYFFLTLANKSIVSADLACDPYSCSSTNAYFRVDACSWNTTSCGVTASTPSAPYNCDTGGGPGTCKGPTPGRLGCIQTSPTIPSCECTDPAYSSSCTGPGQSCGPYGGFCQNCTYYGSCAVEQTSELGCCLITTTPTPTPPTPTPTPPPNCPNGSCGSGEDNCNCPQDCSGTCPTPPPGIPDCDVTLSPSTVNLYTDSAPFNITANVSGISGGNVSQVEFSKSNNNISMNPVFDQNGLPYQSYITPQAQGSSTITANVYMGGGTPVCSTTATVNITVNNTPTDEAPDCDSFEVLPSTPVTKGEIVTFTAKITDIGVNLAYGGGFEEGNMNFWPTAYQLNEWWAVPNAIWPSPGSEGAYYAKILALLSATDSHAATDWIETGEDLTNQNYTLKLKAKSHSSSETVSNVYLQREPYLGSWTGHIAPGGNLSMTLNPSSWQNFSASGTWVNPGNGSTTSRFRVVLRPGSTHGGTWTQPMYYDSIKAYKTSEAGIQPDSVRFYYTLVRADGNYCGAPWTEIIPAATQSGNNYTITWDTSTITPGNYIIAVNAIDIQGNASTGNPSGSCSAIMTPRPACYSSQTINICAPSCGGIMCGNTGATPNPPTNVLVNGTSSGNIDLTNSASMSITWDPPIPQSEDPNSDIEDYEIWIWDRNIYPYPSTPTTCDNTTATDCMKYIVNGGSTSSYTTNANAIHSNNITVAIRSRNTTCNQTTYSSFSVNRTYDLVAQVSGNIYEAVVNPSGNNCIMPNPTPAPINIAAPGTTIQASTGGTTASPTDTYSLSNVPYAPTSAWGVDYGFNVTLTLENSDPANSYYCSCPGPGGNPSSCMHTDTRSPWTIANGNPQNFFVTAIDLSNGPWWQAKEGNVYGTAGYSSNVPDAANSYLITQNADNDPKSAGAPLSGGTISAGSGWYTEYNSGGVPPITQPRANNTSHANIVREDYDYFVKNIDLTTIASLNPSITVLPNPATGTLYEDARVFKRTGDLTLNLNALQTVASGTKMIFFVSGNVTINNTGAANRHLIDIADGGYLAIIADGDITISDSVGNTCTYPTCTSTNANIDGVYVASNQLIIEDDGDINAPDNMFVGEGTFVGWQGIDLRRTFDNEGSIFDTALNNTYATEMFNFRPDFNENTPEILQHPNLVWQEVN